MAVFIVCLFYGYVFYRAYISERSLVSIMMVPLILGIIFENRRLSTAWKMLALKIFCSLLIAMLAFLPGRGERTYNFDDHIELAIYWFVFLFVLASVIYHEEKIVPKLTEGITLLQSVSIIYWIADIGFFGFRNIFAYILMAIGLVFCTVSFVHAFSYRKLTTKVRLFLSIWSSIIMIVFAVDHIYRVYNFDYFVEDPILNTGLNMLQYFLLGVSLIYIFQNANMLLVYLPDRKSWYGKEQMDDIRKMNKTHIGRYSWHQIKIPHALLALLFTATVYYGNYSYQIIPRHTLIWLVFWIFPFVILVKERIGHRGKDTVSI